MKMFPIFACAILGAGVGLFASFTDSIGLKIVMMTMGAIPGSIIGGVILGISRKSRTLTHRLSINEIPGIGFSPEEQMKNYWRDKGEIFPMQGHPDPEAVREVSKWD